MEPPLYQAGAAEGTGVQAAFLDVHDANVGGLPEGTLVIPGLTRNRPQTCEHHLVANLLCFFLKVLGGTTRNEQGNFGELLIGTSQKF